MSRRTSEEIAAATRLIVEQEGADAVSMRRVAAVVGITPMAIYRHYRDRDDLLDVVAAAAFDEVANSWVARTGNRSGHASIWETIDSTTETLLDLALERPHLYAFMFINERKGARAYPHEFTQRQSPTLNVLADVLAEAMRTRQLRSDDEWELALTLAATVQGLVQLRRGGRISMSDSEFRALCHRAVRRIIHGLKN